jgi:hypothetical protein
MLTFHTLLSSNFVLLPCPFHTFSLNCEIIALKYLFLVEINDINLQVQTMNVFKFFCMWIGIPPIITKGIRVFSMICVESAASSIAMYT